MGREETASASTGGRASDPAAPDRFHGAAVKATAAVSNRRQLFPSVYSHSELSANTANTSSFTAEGDALTCANDPADSSVQVVACSHKFWSAVTAKTLSAPPALTLRIVPDGDRLRQRPV